MGDVRLLLLGPHRLRACFDRGSLRPRSDPTQFVLSFVWCQQILHMLVYYKGDRGFYIENSLLGHSLDDVSWIWCLFASSDLDDHTSVLVPL
jgi:hypothetical protein